jgi:hypothetical protein
MPPSDPPIASRTRRTPSAVTSACCTRTMSRTVIAGKAPWYGAPLAGSIEVGPVVP